MPTKKRENKRNRRVMKKRNVSASPFSVPRGGAFPPTKYMNLNYSDIFTLTEGGAGTGAFQMFHCDCYDPDTTGVGHQPMYFDQLCTASGPYLVYTVLKTVAQLRFVNISTYPVIVVVYPQIGTSTPASRIAACEHPFGWKHILPPAGTGGAAVQKSLTIRTPKFLGVPLPTMFSSYSGSYGGIADNVRIQVSIYGIGGIGSVVLEANLVLGAKFWRLGNPPTS